MVNVREEHELHDQLNKAVVATATGTSWPALSYEEGVAAALSWVIGHTEDAPMEEHEWMQDGGFPGT